MRDLCIMRGLPTLGKALHPEPKRLVRRRFQSAPRPTLDAMRTQLVQRHVRLINSARSPDKHLVQSPGHPLIPWLLASSCYSRYNASKLACEIGANSCDTQK